MSIKDRVSLAADREGLTLADIARQLGLSLSPLIRSLSNDNRSYKRLPEIAEIIKVPVDWLRNGGPAPWEQDKVADNTTQYDALYTEVQQQSEDIKDLERTIAVLATRYIDLADLAKAKGVDVPESALAQVKEILESL